MYVCVYIYMCLLFMYVYTRIYVCVGMYMYILDTAERIRNSRRKLRTTREVYNRAAACVAAGVDISKISFKHR